GLSRCGSLRPDDVHRFRADKYERAARLHLLRKSLPRHPAERTEIRSVLVDPRLDKIALADEPGDERRGRSVVHLPRVSDLNERTLVHDGDPVGDAERLLLVVRDQDRRDAELTLD